MAIVNLCISSCVVEELLRVRKIIVGNQRKRFCFSTQLVYIWARIITRISGGLLLFSRYTSPSVCVCAIPSRKSPKENTSPPRHKKCVRGEVQGYARLPVSELIAR